MEKPPDNVVIALKQAADKTGVPESLLTAVAYVESRYNPLAESPVGAKGLMQIMPINFEPYGITDPFDVTQSANAGAHILSNLRDKFGNWNQALAAYNWGSGNVTKNPSESQWPQSVRNYVEKVLDGAELKSGNVFLPLVLSALSIYSIFRVYKWLSMR